MKQSKMRKDFSPTPTIEDEDFGGAGSRFP
jgi:hypothetical protein